MFEKQSTARQEAETMPEAPKSSRYAHILEEAYLHDGLPHLPELEVFGVGEVDMEAINEFSLELVVYWATNEIGGSKSV